MKAVVKERIYLLIIIFCVVMCGAMIVTMVTGGVAEEGVEHVPVIREIKVDEQGDDGVKEANDENSKHSNAEEPKESAQNGAEGTSDSKNTPQHEGINETNGDFLSLRYLDC